uniref:von Willebrand factor, type A n=1 Tax=Solibacter usitatus (strain Ellin6076) TaxID=234267 RepID=Q029H1_SOLUE
MQRMHALLAITALCLLAATTAAVATPQSDVPSVTFRSDVTLGRVDAQIVDGENHPVRGLTVQDFILRVDGKPQEIRNFQNEKMPVDVVLLLDVSRSMEPNIRRVAAASHEALRALGEQDRIATMVFDRFSRLLMPFRPSRRDAETVLENVLERETFDGGTDITRGLLDTASYVEQNARRDARRAIVIVTDDQTERNRNEAAVLRALTRSDSVLSALIAPDALHTGDAYRHPPSFDDDRPRNAFGDLIPRGLGSYPRGPRTQSAGTSQIANQSGGDSMAVDQASAFQRTLARIRERYALYFYLPAGMQAGEERSVEVLLTDAARRRYPRAEVRYRRSYLAPNGSNDREKARPTWM